MKFTLITFISCLSFWAYSQNQSATCCSGPSASSEFAALGSDANFSDAHFLPKMDTLENPLGKLIGIPTPSDPDNPRAYGYYINATEPTDKIVLVFHEWWGLNDNIKQEADYYFEALEGKAHVLAVDLYDYKKATTRERAQDLMTNVSEERIGHILDGAFALAGPDAKFATVGWCFGGTWSMQAAIRGGERVLACVQYYGMPESDLEKLGQLESPVLSIFATQDQWITPAIAEKFDSNMEQLEKSHEAHHYDADHAFANPSNPQFNEDMRKDAFEKSIAFLKAQLFE